jgi:hypothetical protein
MKIRTLAAAAILAAAVLAPAPAAHAADWCNPYVFSDNRHTVGVHCDDGPAGTNQYRIAAYFCSSTGCFSAWGNWKWYGAAGRSTVTSTYATVNSQSIDTRWKS